MGFTWYSLTDQVDWISALREDVGHVDQLGLYDLDRKIRPVGEAYKTLIHKWRQFLPTGSISLVNDGEIAQFDAGNGAARPGQGEKLMSKR